MNYWLMKSEPDTFSIDDLAREPGKTACWDGVRNYQARNYLRDGMKKGDLAFFYHSSCRVPGIAGIVTITREGYPDPTAFDPNDDHYDPDSNPDKPRWYMVDVKLVKKLPRVITLEELRSYSTKELRDLVLLRRGNRLSVMPVSKSEWEFINSLA
ncbi:MAG: EVE domain-containing protein [Proteobacteria bacterium]|nr:MAG: EVE domain-containing protein [Pseudomonadota bacterium]